MSDQTPDPLGDVEAAWAAIRRVEQAHAGFHMKPSQRAAERLLATVAGWLAENAAESTSATVADDGSTSTIEYGYGYTHSENHIVVESVVANAGSLESAIRDANKSGRMNRMGNGPLAGLRLWTTYGPVFERTVTTSGWIEYKGEVER